MRWLMIVLLVSLGVLLFAVAGVVRHVWLRRASLNNEVLGERGSAFPAHEETDLESEL